MWLKKLIPRLEPFVCLTLFIFFLLIFGIPAYTKYRTYEVYVKETVVEVVDGLKSPAMTICVDLVREAFKKNNHFFCDKCQISSDPPPPLLWDPSFMPKSYVWGGWPMRF